MIRQQHVINLVRNRIRSGEYAMRGLPSERDLAEETGAARLTARRALQRLVDEGVLERGAGGRLKLAGDNQTRQPQLAFMLPSISSSNAAAWMRDATRATSAANAYLRPIFYRTWDDLALRDALDGMDGVFILPRSDPPPDWLTKRLEKHDCPVVILGSDWTHLGIPSLVLFQPMFVQQLLDHLHELGHRRIDCLSIGSQQRSMSIEKRIERWHSWCELHQISGDLISGPSGDEFIARASQRLILDRLNSQELHATGIIATTMPAAQGAVRAVIDFGLKPGKDISICAVDGELLSELSSPTITALERPDTKPYLDTYVDWMLAKKGELKLTAPIEVSGIRLVKGESTGPAPSGAATPGHMHHAHL